MKNIFLILLVAIIFSSLKSQTYTVRIITNMGSMDVMLYDETPLHRDNFLKLVEAHHYDSLLFHRVIKGFMIQAGDPTSKYANETALLGDGDLPYTIPAEFNTKYYHKKYAFAQARDENPAKASSASQFYIVQGKIPNDSTYIKAKSRSGYDIPQEHKIEYAKFGGTPQLDMSYTVYGELVKGFAVLDKIALVPTDKNDRPLKEVRIITCILLNKKK
jgi:cyclophilin family peptidyl-prolyl cis-trans isomerase